MGPCNPQLRRLVLLLGFGRWGVVGRLLMGLMRLCLSPVLTLGFLSLPWGLPLQLDGLPLGESFVVFALTQLVLDWSIQQRRIRPFG
ncbi:MAG: hypothetical protein AAF766_19490 [Cyanobacteria bacterium P01_D01_bin.14]